MSIDSFTAATMLQAVANGAVDQMADLYKSLKANGSTDQEVLEAHKKVLKKFKPGQLLAFNHSDRVGLFTELRTVTGGFYPATRYPMKVKIIHGGSDDDGVGCTFEYSEEDFSHVKVIAFDRSYSAERVKEICSVFGLLEAGMLVDTKDGYCLILNYYAIKDIATLAELFDEANIKYLILDEKDYRDLDQHVVS